jgi:hypothetical protein
MTDAPRRPLADRPILLAALSLVLAGLATGGLLMWARANPSAVVVGAEGRHDAPEGAACLDCHVPFEGTPSSRCLAPGCHGELATGTPPRSGPAMPLRFHVAVRKQACGQCHVEHAHHPLRFDHGLIPEVALRRCDACHPAEGIGSHARTDAVSCDLCHGYEAWKGAPMRHEQVSQQPCDLCHRRPETEAHATVAGACSDCHQPGSWRANK